MGWNGSGRPSQTTSAGVGRVVSPKGGKGGNNKRTLLFALVIVSIGVISSIYIMSNDTPQLVEENEVSTHAKIKEVTPAPAPKPIPQKSPEENPKFKGLPKDRIFKSAAGDYIYLPKPGEERFPGERAQALAKIGGTNGTVMVEEKRVVEDPEHPWMFHNSIQSDLVQYARPGEFAVPINPNISDKAAWDAINTEIKFHKNDTDQQIEEKQMVREVMQDLKKYMEEGGHAKDYFAQLHDRQELEAEVMLKTRQEVHQILNSGDIEGARDALNVYNQYRRQKGLPEMRVRKLNGPTMPENVQ